MKTLSYGSAVGTFVRVGFMSQVKQAGEFVDRGARFEALSFQKPASKLKAQAFAGKNAHRRRLLSRGAILKSLR